MCDIRTIAAGVLFAGFEGVAIPDDVRKRVAETPLAGFALFAHNIPSFAQARELTDALRQLYTDGQPPCIGIDQEGGRVARLRDGVAEIPAMATLGATRDVALAERTGERVGYDVRRAGFNIDFAPVLDLAIERSTVIGDRSFGADPNLVVEMAGAFARGLLKAGVEPVFKHFPGHGSTSADSHFDLPVIDVPADVLRARDLVPFARLLPNAPAVMTAHVVARAFDAEKPATLSKRILTKLLRDEIGFKGVCFSDCLTMDAIAKTVGVAEGAVQTLQAGADMVLVSQGFHHVAEVIDSIEAAVSDGRLSRERLLEAHDRVRALRANLQPPLAVDAPPPHA